jgi:hypothetical protein
LSAAEARRARGGEKNALALLDRQKGQIGSARGAVPTSGTTSGKSSNTSTLDTPGVTNESLADPEETASANTEHGTFRRQLRACQFQMVGLAMWKKALGADGERDAQFSRGQVELARRETRVAMARLAQIEKAVDTAGSSSNTSWGLFARGLARKETKHQSDRFDDLVQAFELSQRKLAASTGTCCVSQIPTMLAHTRLTLLFYIRRRAIRRDERGGTRGARNRASSPGSGTVTAIRFERAFNQRNAARDGNSFPRLAKRGGAGEASGGGFV